MGQDSVYSGDVVGCGRGKCFVSSQIGSHIPRELAYSVAFSNTICPYRTDGTYHNIVEKACSRRPDRDWRKGP